MSGTCPKCERPITYTKLEPMETKDLKKSYKGVAFKCPYCSTILGFQINPFTLNTDLAKKIKGS